MSETTSPFTNPDKAAHEVIIELIRAGKIKDKTEVGSCLTYLLERYYAENKRYEAENKAQ
jgi:hypothetical protein